MLARESERERKEMPHWHGYCVQPLRWFSPPPGTFQCETGQASISVGSHTCGTSPPPPLVWSHPAQRAVREGAMASRRPARVCAGVLSCLSSPDPPPPPPAKEVLVSSRKSCACFLTFPTNVREQCDERRRESLSPE